MTQPISLSRVRTSLATMFHLPAEASAFAAQMTVILISIACLVVLSATFDARLARDALGLSPEVVHVATLVSACGQSGYMFAASATLAVVCLVARRMSGPRSAIALTLLVERAVYILATLAVSGLAAQLVKHLVGRARPPLMQSFGPYHFDLFSVKNSLASFPSGHSTTVFAMATALGLILPRWRVPLFVAAVLVAASRVMVEAHYVSDIVAGGALGVVAALAVTRFFAGLDLAFEPKGASVQVKGRGSVWAAVTGRTPAS